MTENNFKELVDIVRKLRVECPWDREQSNDSIKAATIEEAYEVVDAIDKKDFDELTKELGDLLLHVVFHSVIAEGENKFNLDGVIVSIKEKLIRRHPHVFGDARTGKIVEVSDKEEVKKNWEAIKLTEGRKSVLEGVPKSLPGLQRANRLQEKASKVGFDWKNKEDVWEKVIEEIKEMKNEEVKSQSAGSGSKLKNEGDEVRQRRMENEVGDVFFTLVNYSRFLGINPENALRKTNEKFIKRFNYLEKKISESGKKIHESNLEEMDKYWNESKNLSAS